MSIEKLNRIDWRKTEKTDDFSYLKQVAKTLKVKFVGVSKEDVRKACLAEKRIGRKPIVHPAITKTHEKAVAKLETKSAQIQFLFVESYHPAIIAIRTNTHITNVYANLRKAGLYVTGKSIKQTVVAKIKATKKDQKVEAEKLASVTAKK